MIDEHTLPFLRHTPFRAVLCVACGVYVGRIKVFRPGVATLANLCKICAYNRKHAAAR